MHTVLLIEDQFEIASMIRLMTSQSGRRALLAMNLTEAEQIWNAFKNEIHLVVADNALPDGSGITFAERIRQERPTLRVIITSGNPEPFLPAGFYRLDKPYRREEYLLLLEQALENVPPGGDAANGGAAQS